LELRVGVFLGSPVSVSLNVKSDESSRTTRQLNELLRAAQAVLLRISDGTYRIKSNSRDLYLTRSQDGTGTVVVQQSDGSSLSQRVRYHFLWPGQHVFND